MGAWGIKSFENDDALDWLSDLYESNDLSEIESALDQIDSDYIETPEACNIIAASEIVLALIGAARSSLPDKAKEWVKRNKSLDASNLKVMAVEALTSALSDRSELNELWHENEEDYEAWVTDVKQLQASIASS